MDFDGKSVGRESSLSQKEESGRRSKAEIPPSLSLSLNAHLPDCFTFVMPVD